MSQTQARPSGPRRSLPGAATFSSLSERDFRLYFIGNLGFFMAMQMQFILRGYLAFDITDSAASLGIIALAISLPMLIVAPIGGVVADRVNKKMLLIVTQTLASAASVLMAVLILAGWVEFWHIVAVSLVTGVVFSFNMPARSAIVPLLVPQHKLMNAISLQMGGMNLTRIVAPAIAGLLIDPLGVGWVYLITAGMFAFPALSDFRLPKHGLTAEARDSKFLKEFAEGLRYVRQDRLMGMLVLTNLLMPLFAFPVQQVLPVFAEDVFHKGASGLGLLAAMSGLGGLAGAVVSANMDRQPAKGRLMLIGALIMGLFLMLFALAPTFIMGLAFLVTAGVGQMLFATTNNTVIQARLDENIRGRVNSLMLMSFGLMPLGVLPITAATDIVGARATIATSSAILLGLVVIVFAALKPMRQLRVDAMAHAEMSRTQAAAMVADGRLSREEADRLSGFTPNPEHTDQAASSGHEASPPLRSPAGTGAD